MRKHVSNWAASCAFDFQLACRRLRARNLTQRCDYKRIAKSKNGPGAIGNPWRPWIGLELSRCSNEKERSGHTDGREGIRFPLLTATDIAL